MRQSIAALAMFVVLGSGSGRVYAETAYYVGPDEGSWHTAEHWSTGELPTTSAYAHIFNDLTVRIAEDVDIYELTVGYVRDGAVIQDAGNVGAAVIHIGRSDADGDYRGSYVLNGGSLAVTHLYVGRSAEMNTFVMNGGDLSTSTMYVGFGSNELGIFTQAGGTVTSRNSIHLGFGDSTAVFNLDGGELTVKSSPYFVFDSSENSYMDFDGGALNLPGNWDFDRLLGMEHSDFRAFGEPATEGDLRFDLVVLGTEVYTQISAVPIPEPSTIILLGMGALGLLAYRIRRR